MDTRVHKHVRYWNILLPCSCYRKLFSGKFLASVAHEVERLLGNMLITLRDYCAMRYMAAVHFQT
jgi:hypothetical protein